MHEMGFWKISKFNPNFGRKTPKILVLIFLQNNGYNDFDEIISIYSP